MVYSVDVLNGEQLQDFFVRLATDLGEITIDEAQAWYAAFSAYFRTCVELGIEWIRKEDLVDFTRTAWELYKQLEWFIELYANDLIGYIWDVERIYDAPAGRFRRYWHNL